MIRAALRFPQGVDRQREQEESPPMTTKSSTLAAAVRRVTRPPVRRWGAIRVTPNAPSL